jgi:hypothetical protein
MLLKPRGILNSFICVFVVLIATRGWSFLSQNCSPLLFKKLFYSSTNSLCISKLIFPCHVALFPLIDFFSCKKYVGQKRNYTICFIRLLKTIILVLSLFRLKRHLLSMLMPPYMHFSWYKRFIKFPSNFERILSLLVTC